MSSLSLTLAIRRPGPVGDPHAAVTGRRSYQVRLDEGPWCDIEVEWDGGARRLLRDLAFSTERREERVGAWLGGMVELIGWSAAATRVRGAAAVGDHVTVEILSDAQEMLGLPWGLLPAGGGRLGRLKGVRLRRAWLDARIREDDPTAARAEGRVGLAWSAAGGPVSEAGHIEALQAASAAAGRSIHLAGDIVPDVSLEGLSRWLSHAREHKAPVRVLHLLCRAAPLGDGRIGLALATHPGERTPTTVSPEMLAAALGPFADMVRMVVISACADDPLPESAWSLLTVGAALHRAGFGAVLASRMPLSRSGSVRATTRMWQALLVEKADMDGCFDAAHQGLSAPEDIRDADAICLLASTSGAGLRPLLFRPWPGLAPLGPGDTALARLREDETERLMNALDELVEGESPRLLVLAGSSGTGRTSLVRAGLVPRLRELGWTTAELRPTGDIESRLGAALALPSGEGRHLVVVDPFETAFALGSGPRRRLVRALWRQAIAPKGRISVLLVLRIEYLGRCSELTLDDTGTRLDTFAIQDAHRVMVTEPEPRVMRNAVLAPAHQAGLEVGVDIATRLATQAADAVPALPHLAASLDRMWRSRDGRLLGADALRAVGDPTRAVLHMADAAIVSLDADGRAEALRVMRALLAPGGSHGPPLPLWQTRAALRPDTPVEARHHEGITSHLIERGLLVPEAGPEGPGLVLAHESLATIWPPLRDGLVPAGTPPAAAAAAAVVAARKSAKPRNSPLPWLVIAAASILFTVGLVVASLAFQRSRAAADVALQEATDVVDDPTQAAVLLRGAADTTDHATWLQLANSALQEPLAQAVLRNLDGPVTALDFSPDSRRLLTLAGGIPAVWSLTSDTTPLARADDVAGSGVTAAAFSPDGRAVLLVTGAGALLEWTPGEGPPRRLWSPGAASPGAAAVDITDKGHHILIATEQGWTILDHRGGVVIDGVVPETDGAAGGAPRAAALNEDSTRWAIAARDGRVWLWNATLPDPARVRHPGVERIQINREGSHLLSLGDGRLRLTDLEKMRGVTRTPTPVTVHTAAFSPIGRHLLVDYTEGDASREGSTHHTRTLSVDLRSEQFETGPLRAAATALMLDEARDRIVRGREDGRVDELNRRDGRSLRVLRGHRGKITFLSVSPDGRWLATASADQTVRVWTTREADSPLFRPLPSPFATAEDLALTSDGKGLRARLPEEGWATLPLDGSADTPTLLEGDTGGSEATLSAPGAGRLLAAGGDETALFDLAVTASCTNAEGTVAGAISQVGEVVLWVAAEDEIIRLGTVDPPPTRCRIGPKGRRVLTRGRTAVQVWDRQAPGAPIMTGRAAPETAGPTATFSPSGEAILTLDDDGAQRRWTLDAAALRARLWSRTATCGGGAGDDNVASFCACEACFGRHPATCQDRGPGPLDRLLRSSQPSICPAG
jgi:WD40 repeat protein